jgi:hypothetical protein
VSLLRRVFLGAGELSADDRAAVERDGIQVLAEGLRGTVTYRNYRAPDRRATFLKRSQNGALAISGRRLVVLRNRVKEIDLPLEDPRLGKLAIGLDKPDRFCLSWDARDFHADRAGAVELRFSTPEAVRIVALLQRRGVTPR